MDKPENTSGRFACIFCNGELRGMPAAKSLAARADLILAADGGAEHAYALGLIPHVIVGDMDSLGDDLWPADTRIERVGYPQAKDRSDGEMAVECAFERGCRHVLLIGAWGGRLDHALGQCALLMRYPGRLGLWDNGLLARAIVAGQEQVLPVAPGGLVSVIPFEEDTRVRTRGLKYALDDEPLRYPTQGISNIALVNHPVVLVTRGTALLCMESGDTWPEE